MESVPAEKARRECSFLLVFEFLAGVTVPWVKVSRPLVGANQRVLLLIQTLLAYPRMSSPLDASSIVADPLKEIVLHNF